MGCSGVLPTTQFAYWKGLGTCDALLCVSRTLQSALERGQGLGLCKLTSTAFDMVNDRGILYTLGSAAIGGSVLSLFTQFLSIDSQHVQVDCCQS